MTQCLGIPKQKAFRSEQTNKVLKRLVDECEKAGACSTYRGIPMNELSKVELIAVIESLGRDSDAARERTYKRRRIIG